MYCVSALTQALVVVTRVIYECMRLLQAVTSACSVEGDIVWVWWGKVFCLFWWEDFFFVFRHTDIL